MRFCVLFLVVGCVSDNNTSDAGTQGTEGGPCYANGTCNAGLVCVVPNTCVVPDASTPDTSTSDVASEVGTDAGACPSTGLLAWWKGDGNPNDTQGFLPLTTKTPSYTNAHSNQGFLFDGTNYLAGSGANAQLPGLKAITLEAWIQPSNLSGPMTIFSRRASGTSPSGFAFYIVTGKLAFASGNALVVTGTTTLAASVTHHVAVTSSASGVTLYLDGAVDKSTSGTIIADDAFDALVGASWGPTSTTTNDFVGWIDELALYSKALTDTDIATLKGGGTKCN